MVEFSNQEGTYAISSVERYYVIDINKPHDRFSNVVFMFKDWLENDRSKIVGCILADGILRVNFNPQKVNHLSNSEENSQNFELKKYTFQNKQGLALLYNPSEFNQHLTDFFGKMGIVVNMIYLYEKDFSI